MCGETHLISEDDALQRLTNGSFYKYDEDTADIACAYIEHVHGGWLKTNMQPDAPLAKLIKAVNNKPENVEEGVQQRDQQTMDYLHAKFTLWRLGMSLAKLGSAVRQVEFQRLAINEFWKSQYVVFIAAFLRDHGCDTTLTAEGNGSSPDLSIDREFGECKESEIGENVRLDYNSLFRKAKEKFNNPAFRPGVFFLEIDPRVLTQPGQGEWRDVLKTVYAEAQAALSRVPNIHVAVLTVMRAPVAGSASGLYGEPLMVMPVVNPKQTGSPIAKKYATLMRTIVVGQQEQG